MKSCMFEYPKILAVLILLALSPTAFAHGERALEPFIRMRTIQWYDIQWSKNSVAVNDQIVLQGRFHVAEDWPNAVVKPDSAFLNLAIPTPVLVRQQTLINGVPVNNSMALELGADYEFEIVLKGRIPGSFHIHPMMNLRDIGVIVGPGAWIEITGAAADFRNPITTIAGQEIDLETFGTLNGVFWHALWLLLAAAWLLWWIRRPIFIPRYRLVRAGQEDALVTALDRGLGVVGIIGVLMLIGFSYVQAERRYPDGIPLQTGRTEIEALEANRPVEVRVQRAAYEFERRSMQLTLKVTNRANLPIQVGELNSATLRFFNPQAQRFDPNYPKELAVEEGLRVEPDVPIEPGQTQILQIHATDAGWHNERLSSITKDTDSRFGAMLFFYDSAGNRYHTSISSTVIPVL